VIQWLLENSPCDVNHRNYAGQTTLALGQGQFALAEKLK